MKKKTAFIYLTLDEQITKCKKRDIFVSYVSFGIDVSLNDASCNNFCQDYQTGIYKAS